MYRGERDMFAEYTQEQKEKQVTEVLLSNIENILLNGTQLILDKVFELVGFDKITDTVLKLILQMNCEKQDFQ
ncbi:MAG: hypothetical protein LBV69_04885, partial [Bacteroidales bacterium]|nr:hypothetical protein [Bacteroidales bacterium]